MKNRPHPPAPPSTHLGTDPPNAWWHDAGILLAAAVGAVVVAWIFGPIFIALGDDTSLWWHARVAEDMAVGQAKVTGHRVRVHAAISTPKTHSKAWADPALELETTMASGQPPVRRIKNLALHFDTRQHAEAALVRRFPVGSVHAVQFRHGQPKDLLLSVDEAPTGLELLGGLLRCAAILAFLLGPLLGVCYWKGKTLLKAKIR